MKSYKTKKTAINILKISPILMYSITVFICLFFLIITSLKSHQEYILNKIGLPHTFVITNFVTVLSQPLFVRWLLNSFILTFFSVLIGSSLAIPLSFGFSIYRFKFRNSTFAIVSSLMVIPPIMLIIPIYEVEAKLKLLNTYFGAIIVYAAWIVPFWTYFLTKFFSSIDRSIIDSARIDGCADFKLLLNIFIPLSKASLVTLTTVSTLWVWNDLLISLVFLQRDKLRSLMVGLTVFKGYYATNVPATFAGLIISTIPMLFFYIFAQRFFIKGVMGGAIKG
jgi:ABC-type glycerol-3-phosphate transport system permease component